MLVLRTLRQARDESQADVARTVGISQSYLSRLELAKFRPSATVIAALGKHFPEADREELFRPIKIRGEDNDGA